MAYSERSTNSLDTFIPQEASEDTALQEMDLIPLGDIEQELKSLENFPSEQMAQSFWRCEAEEERKGEQNQQRTAGQYFPVHDPAIPSTSNAMLDFNSGFFQHPSEDPNTYGGFTNLRTTSAAADIIPETHIGNSFGGHRYLSHQNYALFEEDPFDEGSAFPTQEYSPIANSTFDMSMAHITTPGTSSTASGVPSFPYAFSPPQQMAFGATDASQNASIVAPVANPPFDSYWSGTTSLSGPSVSSHSEQILGTKDCSSELGSLQVSSEEAHAACSTPQEPPVIPSSPLNPRSRKVSFKYRNRRQFLEGEKKKSHEHQLANTRSKDYNERQKKDKIDKEKQRKFLEEENKKLEIKCNELEALRNNYRTLYSAYKDYLPSIPDAMK